MQKFKINFNPSLFASFTPEYAKAFGCDVKTQFGSIEISGTKRELAQFAICYGHYTGGLSVNADEVRLAEKLYDKFMQNVDPVCRRDDDQILNIYIRNCVCKPC